MGLHHASLKAAVSKYLPLVEEGKNEEEIKAALKSDEKGFSDEAIIEIFDALVGSDKGEEPGEEFPKVFTVVKEFRDINDFSFVNEVGDDVTHFDSDRLNTLIALGLVEVK
jgi:hypothetical protein